MWFRSAGRVWRNAQFVGPACTKDLITQIVGRSPPPLRSQVAPEILMAHTVLPDSPSWSLVAPRALFAQLVCHSTWLRSRATPPTRIAPLVWRSALSVEPGCAVALASAALLSDWPHRTFEENSLRTLAIGVEFKIDWYVVENIGRRARSRQDPGEQGQGASGYGFGL